jgi:hypothetical protein
MSLKLYMGVSVLLLVPALWGAPGQPSMGQQTKSADRTQREHAVAKNAAAVDSREQAIDELIRQIATSGQIIELSASSSERLSLPARVAPGEPPVLRFRYLQGADHMRFGKLDLVVDDAGH